MRVILEVRSGPSSGRKVLLGTGQELRVGRTEWADFAILDDGRMSGIHFAVETDNRSCYIRDLGSSNGTFVNGQPVSKTTALASDDEIVAGETHFRVRIESDAPAENVPRGAPAAALPGAAVAAVGRGPPAAAAAIRYTSETCPSGLTLCRGAAAAMAPAKVAALLSTLYPLYWIVDFKKLGVPTPSGIVEPAYLFDWLPRAAAQRVSPLVLSAAELPVWPELVDQGWGSDGLVGLFSRQARPALVAHLRRACHVKPDREGPMTGMLGYCWPSVMSLLLSHNTPRFVEQLLSGIDAALVELPDLPDTWQLYGGAQVAADLDRLGMSREENN
jgi:hypothetical protein